MVDCLQEITRKLRKPSAIIVVSAHWEEDLPTATSGAHPSLIYDYYGFPEASYSIRYPCPGDPDWLIKFIPYSTMPISLPG